MKHEAKAMAMYTASLLAVGAICLAIGVHRSTPQPNEPFDVQLNRTWPQQPSSNTFPGYREQLDTKQVADECRKWDQEIQKALNAVEYRQGIRY